MTARAAQAGIARGSTDYLVVFVTYLAAASLRAARQGVAAVKPELQSDANFTATALDAMDTVYLLSLGSVLIVSGAIGKMKGNLSVRDRRPEPLRGVDGDHRDPSPRD